MGRFRILDFYPVILASIVIGAWTMPARASSCDPCGKIDSYGCCDGDTLKICQGGCLKVKDCTPDSCRWDDTWSSYDCMWSGDGDREDPWGMHPRQCPSCTPSCSGKQCGDDGCGGSCGKCTSGQQCKNGKCVACTPNCSGKQCGDDGCGGSCGSCSTNETCKNGKCEPKCTPNCSGKQCGDDGCGGSCGSCPANHDCINGKCVCRKQCTGKQCGPDGCGGSCGTCASGSVCTFNGLCCQPNCTGKQCGGDGCGGSCGTCQSGYSCVGGKCVGGAPPQWTCASTKYGASDGCDCNCGAYDPDCDKQPVPAYNCNPNEVCTKSGKCCKPDCSGKQCGDDGCGGSCGTCTSGQQCKNGQCVAGCTPNCAGKQCGDDGCGGSCGTCNAGYVCSNHQCVSNTPGQDIIVSDQSQVPDAATPDAGIVPDNAPHDSAGPPRPDTNIASDSQQVESGGFFIDVGPILSDGQTCPDGMVYRYGRCMPEPQGPGQASGASSTSSGGCSTGSGAPGAGNTLLLLISWLVGMLLIRRRKGRI